MPRTTLQPFRRPSSLSSRARGNIAAAGKKQRFIAPLFIRRDSESGSRRTARASCLPGRRSSRFFPPANPLIDRSPGGFVTAYTFQVYRAPRISYKLPRMSALFSDRALEFHQRRFTDSFFTLPGTGRGWDRLKIPAGLSLINLDVFYSRNELFPRSQQS